MSSDRYLPEYVLDDTGASFLPPTPQGLRGRDDDAYSSRSGGYGGSTNSLLDYLTRELHRYRAAVSRMGQDIVTLTDEIRELDAENESLRQGHGQLGPNEHAVIDVDGNEYVATLNESYSNNQDRELQEYKNLVHKLQNDLIMANNNETKLMMSKDERLYEQLTDESSRVKKLEDACRRQEAVIMEMEKQLAEKVSRSGNIDASHDVLVAENRRLRDELKRNIEDSRRYYNEYQEYLNRYWNSADEYELIETPNFERIRSPRTKEYYNLDSGYKTRRLPSAEGKSFQNRLR